MAQPKPKANEKQSKPTKAETWLIIRKPKPGRAKVSLAEIAANARKLVPEEEWAKVPTDLAANIDKYLYSSPSQEIV